MITRKQYARLTIILLAPLIFVGIWLAGEEKILPWSNIISCVERDLIISCDSKIASQKSQREYLHRSGATRLQGADYIGSLDYFVTTSPFDGDVVTKKHENVKLGSFLTSQKWVYNTENSCEISYFDENKKWLYYCGSVGGYFEFDDNNIDRKFKEALGEIKTIRETRKLHKWIYVSASIMIPLILYFLISALLLFFSCIARFVIYGRFKK